MPKVLLVADANLISALFADRDLPITDRERIQGTIAESERLGFELGSVETIIGYIAAGIDAITIARRLIAARQHSPKPKLEITSPTARISVDLEGKTDEEIAALVRTALPFTR